MSLIAVLNLISLLSSFCFPDLEEEFSETSFSELSHSIEILEGEFSTTDLHSGTGSKKNLGSGRGIFSTFWKQSCSVLGVQESKTKTHSFWLLISLVKGVLAVGSFLILKSLKLSSFIYKVN